MDSWYLDRIHQPNPLEGTVQDKAGKAPKQNELQIILKVAEIIYYILKSAFQEF